MSRFIPLMMIFLLSISVAFGVLGDILTTYDISTSNLWEGSTEAIFSVGNEWHIFTINNTNGFIGVLDSNFNAINGSGALEHFTEPIKIFNTDGAYNGTHYFLKQPNIGVYYVYDSNFNFVQNITPVVDGNAIAWNGSTFIGSDSGDLKDLGSDLQSNILLASGIIDDTGGLSQSGDILFVGGAQGAETNITSYNTSNNYIEINKRTTSGFMSAVGSNGSNVLLNSVSFQQLDSDLNLISNPVISPSVGANDARGLTFDGTNFWILDRNLNKWWKYDQLFNVVGSFSIAASGSNWRSGTALNGDLYAWNQDDDMVYVYTQSGVFSFSFDPAPLRDTAGNIRGLTNNGSHLFITNYIGDGSIAKVASYSDNGVYTGINISLEAAGVGDRILALANVNTLSTDIIGSCGDANDNWGFLCRWDSTGTNILATNFSTIGINSSFPYGLEYVPAENRIYVLNRFASGDPAFTNPNLITVLDGGNLNVPPSMPNLITGEVTLDNFDTVGVSFIRILVALFIVIGIGAAFRSSFK